MSSWTDVRHEAPELAAQVEARLRAYRHHVLATVRRDGAPRVSGTEVVLHDDGPTAGRLLLGCMPGSRKGADMRRDPRVALHSNPGDGSMVGGDAKISGRVHEVTDQAVRDVVLAGAPDAAEAEVWEVLPDLVVLTELHPAGDRLRVTRWRTGDGVSQIERS